MPKFISEFDEECKRFVESLIDSSPLKLRKSNHFGMGLYVNKDIVRGELILREVPFLSTAINSDPRVTSVASHCLPGWTDDYYLVASAVAVAMKSDAWPFAPHSCLPLRCLGYTRLNTTDDVVVQKHLFSIITKVFELQDVPESVWSPTECQIVYDKVKSNCFVSGLGSTDVFCAASMLNHSCVPNAAFTSFDSLSAVQDISAGEQVFVSYNVMDPKVDLPELYGFECRCPRCLPQGSNK